MRSNRTGRAASIVLTLVASLANSGCPELNRQPDHAADPMFNIADPITWEGAASPGSAVPSSEEGGLPDQAPQWH